MVILQCTAEVQQDVSPDNRYTRPVFASGIYWHIFIIFGALDSAEEETKTAQTSVGGAAVI